MKSAMHCEHANEVPSVCPCPRDCYCKGHTCDGRVSVSSVPVIQYQMPDEQVWLRMWEALAAKGLDAVDRLKASDAGLQEFKKRFR